jgi:hypothetical protein
MTNFEEYLALYEIDPVRLSIEAHVRYLTIYNAKKGHPVLPENAQKIRDALLRLTGVPYVGSFVLIKESPPPERPNNKPGHHHRL